MSRSIWTLTLRLSSQVGNFVGSSGAALPLPAKACQSARTQPVAKSELWVNSPSKNQPAVRHSGIVTDQRFKDLDENLGLPKTQEPIPLLPQQGHSHQTTSDDQQSG